MKAESQHFSFLSTSDAPERLYELRELFLQEWDSLGPFEGTHPDVAIPLPIVAIDSQGSLAGGLAFTTFKNPNNEQIAVWINALLITSEFRGKGLAKQLVRDAEQAARDLGITELFVQTEYSNLYSSMGWSEIAKNTSGTILVRDV